MQLSLPFSISEKNTSCQCLISQHCAEGHTFSTSCTNIPTSSEVHPSTSRQIATIMEPPIMNGRRLPHFERERSAMIPTIGCIIRPDSGPAIHTNDVRDFVKPSWRRYGVQSRVHSNKVSIRTEDHVWLFDTYTSFQCPK